MLYLCVVRRIVVLAICDFGNINTSTKPSNFSNTPFTVSYLSQSSSGAVFSSLRFGGLGPTRKKIGPALRPCYTAQFSQQLVSQCHCETSCWRIAQCNMVCLAIFLLREALHEVELNSTFRNGLQQLTTPLHSVSPLQQLVSQFYGSFNKGACAHFLFFVPRTHCETSCWENCTV